MSNIVDLTEYRPHFTGPAKCLSCNHEWTAVCAVGTVEFQCPRCHTFKGVSIGMTAPQMVFTCDCGNQHFYLGDGVYMCSRCGQHRDYQVLLDEDI